MKLKKKEDQSVDASVLLRRGNKMIMGGRGREGPGRESGQGIRGRRKPDLVLGEGKGLKP